MDYSIPIPIRQNKEYKEGYECICKYCQNPKKYVSEWDGYSYLYNYCMCCNKRVWYYHQVCSLYGRRSPFVVCFYCRIPFYEKKLTNGEIYKIAKKNKFIQ